ncbi:unnamed protein product [Prunus armeniaca]|uniref:Uncharacterized protein n=1 Tax=Prunus armeniaca TaxID=36596 RepID=A0A6J5XID1_PRUAR|nr:unnamed protein product [Prunus armeniaca]
MSSTYFRHVRVLVFRYSLPLSSVTSRWSPHKATSLPLLLLPLTTTHLTPCTVDLLMTLLQSSPLPPQGACVEELPLVLPTILRSLTSCLRKVSWKAAHILFQLVIEHSVSVEFYICESLIAAGAANAIVLTTSLVQPRIITALATHASVLALSTDDIGSSNIIKVNNQVSPSMLTVLLVVSPSSNMLFWIRSLHPIK